MTKPDNLTDAEFAELSELQARKAREMAVAKAAAANDVPAPLAFSVPAAKASGALAHTRRAPNGQVERLRTCACGTEVWCPLQGEAACPGCLPARRRESRLLSLAPALASIPDGFRWARLDDSTLAERAANQVAVAAFRSTPVVRALLFGKPGSGKTSLAAAYLRSWLESVVTSETTTPGDLALARTARFVAAHDLAAAARETKLGSTPSLVAEALVAKMLVLDEVGSEPAEGWSTTQRVIHDRHARGLCTLVTTGHPMSKLVGCYGAGIERRLTERALVFDMGGEGVAP